MTFFAVGVESRANHRNVTLSWCMSRIRSDLETSTKVREMCMVEWSDMATRTQGFVASYVRQLCFLRPANCLLSGNLQRGGKHYGRSDRDGTAWFLEDSQAEARTSPRTSSPHGRLMQRKGLLSFDTSKTRGFFQNGERFFFASAGVEVEGQVGPGKQGGELCD